MRLGRVLPTCCLIGTACSQSKFKIMPLGDSITEITCWRAKLWNNLKASNLTDKIEFVGSVNNTQSCDTADAEFATQHHEGHTGYLAIDVAYDHIDKWLDGARPDVVTFMLGTDDVARGRRIEDVVEAYSNMVRSMRKYNAGVRVVVRSRLVPSRHTFLLASTSTHDEQVNTVVPLPANMAPVERLNDMIPDWAAEMNTTESPVYVDDIYPFPNAFLKDGIHPNEQGEDRIAEGLTSLLTWIVGADSTGGSAASG
ncbi:carbohydrate esterase family 3 protein [Daldinia caldariorum]|uniref:carbohydrate esterase family 3 protein n=1 Tax=Daldinia caldariorum TaxID=326644 RepID=UPI00200805C4|nr:carbohydrate esterase family 3 protein [Daldinia caldariorum]KAI1468809.1 carbohydrate esterase family 3 protein [Daldinia caldariorum]